MMRGPVRRILAVARTETLRLLLDRSSMGLILLVPAVQLILFGFAVNLTPKNVTFAISRSCGPHRDLILTAVGATRAFAVVTENHDSSPSQHIAGGRALVAMDCRGETLSITADGSAPSAVRPAVAALQVEPRMERCHLRL